MAPESEDRAANIFLYSLTALMIIGSAGSVLIVIHNWHTASGALMKTAELVAGAIMVGGGAFATGKITQAAIGIVADIRIHYTVQYKAVKRHVPSFFAGAVLVAETWMIVVDKSFHGDEVKTIVVSIVTLLFFAIAKHLGDKGKWRKIAAWAIWTAGILLLPIAVCLNEKWGLAELLQHIRGLAVEAQIVIGLSIPALLLVPFAFESEED